VRLESAAGWRWLRPTLVAGVTVVFGSLAGASASAASGTPVWPAAGRLELPSGAATGEDQLPKLNSVTCTGPGSCVAVGSYNDTRHSARGEYDDQAMVITETRGMWGRASELMLPSGANPPAGDQTASLASVTCTGPGNCVAVGAYTDGDGGFQPMVATEAGGTWGRASEIALPSDVNATTATGVGLDSVTCTSQGNCVAVGAYDDNSPSQQAMIATETGGVWAQASKLALPSNAETASGNQSAELT
jgi:ferredoxin